MGNLSDVARDRLGFLQRMARIGDVCGFRLGPFPGIFFNKPEHIQNILVEHTADVDKGVEAIRYALPSIVRHGIVCQEGEMHRRQRKFMAPVFQPRHLASYAGSMVAYGEQLQSTWPDGSVIDINQQMSHLTMNILGKVLFDADVLTEGDELGAAIMAAFEYLSYVTAAFFAPPYNWPTPRNRRMRHALQVLQTNLQRFINERRSTPCERNDFLSLLLQARGEDGAGMADDQLMAECLSIFGAGYETTATALGWTWILLCQHPEIYQRVQQEVDSVLQGRTPTYADLADLPYCLQVLREALRLYPPVYMTCRRALHDIEIDGHRIAKGRIILLSPYTLHRRADYFPIPEQFDPERFTPEQEKRRPRCAYVPFGAGPRICLGMHFALMEAHLLLATIAQRTTFSLVPHQAIDLKIKYSLLLRPTGTVKMVVTKRRVTHEQGLLSLHGARLERPQMED